MKKFRTVIPVTMIISAEDEKEARGLAEAFATEYLMRQGKAFTKLAGSERPIYETGIAEIADLEEAPTEKESAEKSD